jgi:hypothetical protein
MFSDIMGSGAGGGTGEGPRSITITKSKTSAFFAGFSEGWKAQTFQRFSEPQEANLTRLESRIVSRCEAAKVPPTLAGILRAQDSYGKGTFAGINAGAATIALALPVGMLVTLSAAIGATNLVEYLLRH